MHCGERWSSAGVGGTVMCNRGVELALPARGIDLVRVKVGDRFVVEEMLRGGYVFGGEPSGHLVFLDHATTGDGIMTALAVLALMVESGKPLSTLRRVMEKFPQRLVNVPIGERRDLETVPEIKRVIERARSGLGKRGRVLVRYSGTEPVVRVMVEGEHSSRVEAMVEEIATTIRHQVAS